MDRPHSKVDDGTGYVMAMYNVSYIHTLLLQANWWCGYLSISFIRSIFTLFFPNSFLSIIFKMIQCGLTSNIFEPSNRLFPTSPCNRGKFREFRKSIQFGHWTWRQQQERKKKNFHQYRLNTSLTNEPTKIESNRIETYSENE